MTALKVAAQSVYRMWSSRVVLVMGEQAASEQLSVILSSLTFHISSFVSLSYKSLCSLPEPMSRMHISCSTPHQYNHRTVLSSLSGIKPSTKALTKLLTVSRVRVPCTSSSSSLPVGLLGPCHPCKGDTEITNVRRKCGT